MPTLHEIAESRVDLYAKMKALNDKALSENREFTGEETAEWTRMETTLDELGAQRDAHVATTKRAERLAALEAESRQPRNPTTRRADPTNNPIPSNAVADQKELIKGIYQHLESSVAMGASRQEALKELIKIYNSSTELGVVRSAARRFISTGANSLNGSERAALQMDVDASGGTLVMPEEFVARLIIGLDERVFMRSISTVLPLTSAESVGIPSLETDPADADWTTELAVGSEDTAMATGKRNLHPHPLGKLIKVSKTLLRRAAIPAESLVRDRLLFKFAVTEEKGYLTGNGANQPLGVFTASAAGINTDRDISTDNTSTNLTADGLINAKYNLASQYMASANLRWVFHRTVVRNIRKLKDGSGQYLWTAGLSGAPDTILEVPYEMSEYAPSTFTASQYLGIIGDFQWYWIAESLRFELQRLDELYAATNQVGFIGRLETDGMPVLSEAFSRVSTTA